MRPNALVPFLQSLCDSKDADFVDRGREVDHDFRVLDFALENRDIVQATNHDSDTGVCIFDCWCFVLMPYEARQFYSFPELPCELVERLAADISVSRLTRGL